METTTKNKGKARAVVATHRSVRTIEGGGFPVRRALPHGRLVQIDPFLLLDEMGPVHWPPDEALGAPSHPHRGFDTVTYLLRGEMEHRDSSGHTARIGPGAVQWMTAGAGIIHSELPTQAFKATGGWMHGFQVWVNLPAALKMTPAGYQMIEAAFLPTWRDPEGQVTLRIIAGEAHGVSAIAHTKTPITYIHLSLQPGACHALPLPPSQKASLYLFGGTVQTGPTGTDHEEGELLELGSGDHVWTRAGDDGCELLVLAATPLCEPVVRYGPFVMNTEAEIHQAIADYRAGRMG
jgi:redox-sensitive bicupin YhaK (pirin superfamily)